MLVTPEDIDAARDDLFKALMAWSAKHKDTTPAQGVMFLPDGAKRLMEDVLADELAGAREARAFTSAVKGPKILGPKGRKYEKHRVKK